MQAGQHFDRADRDRVIFQGSDDAAQDYLHGGNELPDLEAVGQPNLEGEVFGRVDFLDRPLLPLLLALLREELVEQGDAEVAAALHVAEHVVLVVFPKELELALGEGVPQPVLHHLLALQRDGLAEKYLQNQQDQLLPRVLFEVLDD